MTQTGGDGCFSAAAALGGGESCGGGVTQTSGDDDIVPSAAALGVGGVTKTLGCLTGDGEGEEEGEEEDCFIHWDSITNNHDIILAIVALVVDVVNCCLYLQITVTVKF